MDEQDSDSYKHITFFHKDTASWKKHGYIFKINEKLIEKVMIDVSKFKGQIQIRFLIGFLSNYRNILIFSKNIKIRLLEKLRFRLVYYNTNEIIN